MVVNSREMQGVSVRTASGQSVGKMVSFNIDADTGRLATILVKISGVVPSLLGQEALVAWSQIISMDPMEIVVADGFAAERITWLAKSLAAPQSNISMREAPRTPPDA